MPVQEKAEYLLDSIYYIQLALTYVSQNKKKENGNAQTAVCSLLLSRTIITRYIKISQHHLDEPSELGVLKCPFGIFL